MLRFAAAMSPFPSASAAIEEPHGEMLALELLVLGDPLLQLPLDQLERIVGDPALRALVVEIEGLAGHNQHADDPALDHLVQIALPGLRDRLRIDGQVFSGGVCGLGDLREGRDGREQGQQYQASSNWATPAAMHDLLLGGRPQSQ
jgi:hypothetical protein